MNIKKIIKEEFQRTLINESSLKRIEHWIDSNDIAAISASRNEMKYPTENTLMDKEVGESYSRQENIRRNRELKSALLKLGYGVTRVQGSYIEDLKNNPNKEEPEESFIVVNLNNDPDFYENLFKLSEYYNQDSFMMKYKDDDEAYLVGTNLSDFPGYKDKSSVGTFKDKVNATFMSRLGAQGFAFTNKDNPAQEHTPQTFQKRKDYRNKYIHNIPEALQLETFDSLQINSKRICEQRSKKVLNDIK
jgi:hypothetical protein